MKLYTLENDYLFKKIFSNQEYLKRLLLDLFDVKAEKLEYLNTTLIKENKKSKVGIVDMLLNIDGEITLLELQNINRHNFKERLLFYSSNIMTLYGLKGGEDYRNLKNIKVYAIINYKRFNNNIKDIIKLKRKNKIFTEKVEFQIFDLTKVDKNDSNNKYYELVNLFNVQEINKLDKIMKSDIYKKILEEIKKYNLDSEERIEMENIINFVEPEEEHYENAYIDGFEIGSRQGRSEGIIENKRKIAKSMIEENIDIKLVSKITGLTQEQISAL